MTDFVSRALLVAVLALAAAPAARAEDPVKRGEYLVTIGGCSDCHTPGSLLGHPDKERFLGGSDVGFAIPGLGVFAGRNLTPDKETGLGTWTDEEIVKAMTTGVRPDGRVLAPVMPYRALSHLSAEDAQAIVAYLRTLKPVANAVPGPFGETQTPTLLVMQVVPPEVYAAMPKPGAKPAQ